MKNLSKNVMNLEPQKPGILSKLKRIKIEAPADFAENLDLYLSGEKQCADDSNFH